MNQDGFSLTEMLIVICVSAILLSLATVSFNTWNNKSKIETQFRTLYADLMGVRSQALYQKKPRSVTFTSTRYSIYSSANTAVSPIRQTNLKVAVTVPTNLRIDFDQMGFATFSNTSTTVYICPQANATKAVINSIILSQTRMQMGSLSGTGCNSAKPQ